MREEYASYTEVIEFFRQNLYILISGYDRDKINSLIDGKINIDPCINYDGIYDDYFLHLFIADVDPSFILNEIKFKSSKKLVIIKNKNYNPLYLNKLYNTFSYNELNLIDFRNSVVLLPAYNLGTGYNKYLNILIEKCKEVNIPIIGFSL